MASRKAECNSDLQRFLGELENLKSEKNRLEGEIKKEKLIAANYDESVKKLTDTMSETTKKLEKMQKQTRKEDEKTLKIQTKLFEQKVVYQWLEANSYVAGESAEEIMQNQQAYLVEAIQKVRKFIG